MVICPNNGLEKEQNNGYSAYERVPMGIIFVKLQCEWPSVLFQLSLLGYTIPHHE